MTSPGTPGCLFCGIGADEPGRDRDNLVLLRGETCFALLNRFPYINGHLMLVPFRHVPDFTSASREEVGELMEMVRLAEKAFHGVMKCQGINGGWNIGSAAGAGVPGHLHLHVLPRWSGDTNFMSAVGGVRVLSQSLEETWERIAPVFGDRG